MPNSLRIKRYYQQGVIRNELTDKMDSMLLVDNKKHFVIKKVSGESRLPILLGNKVSGNITLLSGNIIKNIELETTLLPILNKSLDAAVEDLRSFLGCELYII